MRASIFQYSLMSSVAIMALPTVAIAQEIPAAAANSSPQAQGQPAEPALPTAEILVTARKRQESILKVPVVVTALSQQQITDVQLTQVTDLPRLVPGLIIGANLLSIGPQVTIRGVGTSASDPGVDQSVSLNIDGLSLGQGLAFGSALFDVGQVEVLKGPQALFYGKGSPGGVISLRTADPGLDLEIIGRASYEFEAREKRGELIVSGPVTDTLGLRLAGAYSEADGYFRNSAVPVLSTGAVAGYKREPQPRNFVLRGTLLWKPSSDFSARLKVNHAYDKAIYAEQWQAKSCPDGNQSFGFGSGVPGSGIPAAPNFLTPVDPIPFLGTDCKLDRNADHVYLNPVNFPGATNNGVPFLRNEQNFGTLEFNYNLTPELSLNSTTAYYKLNSASLVNAIESAPAAPFLGVTNQFSRREFTQELRLESDFKTPLNFMLGAFYQDGRLYDRVHFLRNTAYGFLSPAIVGAEILNDERSSTVDIKTYSLFGQLRYKFTDTLELAGGVRWADETRDLAVYDFLGDYDLTPFLPSPRVHSSTFSPEVTLTYTPSDDLTLFASYKKGYKSGSFSVAVPASAIRDAGGQVIGATDASFDDEQVRGYEIGAKARFLDRALTTNLAFYDYRYRGLQVGGIEPSRSGGSPIVRTVNAGRARTYGVDFDIAYRPPGIDGLNLSASINWNRGRYLELNNIPCYESQTVASGCNVQFTPFPATAGPGQNSQAAPGPGAVVINGQSGYYSAQDLSGTPLIRSPDWAANFGFDYELPVSSGMKVRVTSNNQYSGRYSTFLARGRPNDDNFQSSFVKMDASIALSETNDRWEVALVGKNLTDKVTASSCGAGNYAGGNIIGGSISGGSTLGGSGLSEVGCFAEAGRAVYLRLTVKPFN